MKITNNSNSKDKLSESKTEQITFRFIDLMGILSPTFRYHLTMWLFL